jgi:hypothetical protein
VVGRTLGLRDALARPILGLLAKRLGRALGRLDDPGNLL